MDDFPICIGASRCLLGERLACRLRFDACIAELLTGRRIKGKAFNQNLIDSVLDSRLGDMPEDFVEVMDA